MSTEGENPILEPPKKEAVLTVEEMKKRGDLLKQKINLQRLVMAKMHYTLPEYEPNPRNKKRAESRGLAISEKWSQETIGKKGLTRADIFAHIFQRMISNDSERELIKTNPNQAVQQIAEEINKEIS